MTTIYLEYEGVPTPISELNWVQRAACGCYSGVASAEHGEDGPVTSAEEARKEFIGPAKVLLQRSVEEGKTYELRSRTWYREHEKEFWAPCPHDPKWGVKKVVLPEGKVWATNRVSRAKHIRHIVDSGVIGNYLQGLQEALCGATHSMWQDEKHNPAETVTCRKCEAEVEALLPKGASEGRGEEGPL